MKRPIRILLQTTIPEIDDNWHIGRFSLLRDHLASLKDEAGNALCRVTARNRVVYHWFDVYDLEEERL